MATPTSSSAPTDYDTTGKAYVYHGSARAWMQPQPGFGESGGDRYGLLSGHGGDVNGDGFADLVVGAYGTDRQYRARPTSTTARQTASVRTPAWSATGENGGDWYGDAVGTAGDVNGDGYADIITGAPQHDGS